jgi:hypothetical protein
MFPGYQSRSNVHALLKGTCVQVQISVQLVDPQAAVWQTQSSVTPKLATVVTKTMEIYRIMRNWAEHSTVLAHLASVAASKSPKYDLPQMSCYSTLTKAGWVKPIVLPLNCKHQCPCCQRRLTPELPPGLIVPSGFTQPVVRHPRLRTL